MSQEKKNKVKRHQCRTLCSPEAHARADQVTNPKLLRLWLPGWRLTLPRRGNCVFKMWESCLIVEGSLTMQQWTRLCILCVTHQMSGKLSSWLRCGLRDDNLYKVKAVGAWWYWVSIWRYYWRCSKTAWLFKTDSNWAILAFSQHQCLLLWKNHHTFLL